jgi:uncharacterized protein
MTTKDAMMTTERKSLALEVKADAEGRVEGYASRFNQIDQGNDSIAPGAYAASLGKGRNVKMLWQHDPSQPIGVWEEVKEDKTGLFVRGRIYPDAKTANGVNFLEMVKDGAVDGLSIGYRTMDSERGSKGERILKEVDLWEVSLVTFPMQETARVDAVKAAEMSRREIEQKLTQDAGFSRSVARALMGGGSDAIKAMHDAGGDRLDELRDLLAARKQ